MKKSLYFILGIIAVSLINCKGQSDKPVNTSKSSDTSRSVPLKATDTDSDAAAIHITRADFLKLVMDYEKNPEVWSFQGEKPCIVDFYADWCAPCRITSPILEDLAKEYAGRINVYKVNVDKEEELASVFGIQSIPTFLFCPLNGNPTISSGIANSPEATRKMFIQQIEELLLKAGNTSTI